MAALVGTLRSSQGGRRDGAETGVCAAANDNGGGQVVLSGAKSAVERAVEIAKEQGVKRAMILPVSAPFHCPLMQPAADAMAEALSQVEVKPPRVPLVANVLAEPITDPAAIVRALIAASHRHGPLAGVGCVHGRSGRYAFYEVGAGRVLTGLIKRIAEGRRVDDWLA